MARYKKSSLEKAMWKQLKAEGLGNVFVPEFRFHPVRRWRFDLASPETRLACEIQGGIFTYGAHSRPSGQLKDYEKFSEAAIMGWRIVLVSSLEIRNGQALDRLKRALEWEPPKCSDCLLKDLENE